MEAARIDVPEGWQACVTLGMVRAAPGGGDVLQGLYFVGGTDPARRIGSVVAGTARLAPGAACVVHRRAPAGVVGWVNIPPR